MSLEAVVHSVRILRCHDHIFVSSPGILAITLAEAVFWALGYPAALIYYKLVDNVWIDVFSKDGAIKAAGFSGTYPLNFHALTPLSYTSTLKMALFL